MICSTPPSALRSSRMYAITGLPATLSIGLGVTCVCGRSRVPFPASGMMTFMVPVSLRCACPFSSVAVAEPHDVVQVRRGGLEHVAVRHRLHVVDGARRDAERLPDLELHILQLLAAVELHPVDHLPRQQVDRLILAVVILH